MKEILKHFIGASQLRVIRSAMLGEEGPYFKAKMDELAATIESMPKVYEQDGKGDAATVYLHYFKGGMDWYILEKDSVEGEFQLQAFGWSNLGYGAELGYISIEELIRHNVELDLHWMPDVVDRLKAVGKI